VATPGAESAIYGVCLVLESGSGTDRVPGYITFRRGMTSAPGAMQVDVEYPAIVWTDRPSAGATESAWPEPR